MIPPVATEFLSSRREKNLETLDALLKQWRRMGSDFDSSWSRIEPRITVIMRAAQKDAAEESRDYFVDALEATNQPVHIDDRVNINAFVGVNGDGRQIQDALYGSVIVAKHAIDTGKGVGLALQTGGRWLTEASNFALADTCRAVNRVQFPSMRVGGYVRVLTPPSCARCAVLAGKRYSSEVAFKRHPRCDCAHYPANEEVSKDLLFNAEDYFDSLPEDQQNKIFTNAGAEAIRNGADINQVVNARRGMYTTADGRKATREGITKRGVYGWSQRNFRKVPGKRYREAVRARFMPEQIQEIAGGDRERYLNMLRFYGYLL